MILVIIINPLVMPSSIHDSLQNAPYRFYYIILLVTTMKSIGKITG